MEVTELRIGNWVIDNYLKPDYETNEDPIGWDYYKIEYGCDIDHYKDYEPIPLTEEILSKCDLHTPTNSEVYHFKKDGLEYFYVKGQGLKVYQGICGLTDYPCEYLHQLQNLYYSICGEELKVNLQ